MNHPVVIVSHRRSGTHWTIDALRHNVSFLSSGFLNLDRLLPGHESPLSLQELRSTLSDVDGRPLLKTHIPPRLEPLSITSSDIKQHITELLEQLDTVYDRDGRNVLVPLYFYMSQYDSNIEAKRFSDFINDNNSFDMITLINRIKYYQYHIDDWLGRSRSFNIFYRDLRTDYSSTLVKLANFIREKLSRKIIEVVCPGKTNRRFFSSVFFKVKIRTWIKTVC